MSCELDRAIHNLTNMDSLFISRSLALKLCPLAPHSNSFLAKSNQWQTPAGLNWYCISNPINAGDIG